MTAPTEPTAHGVRIAAQPGHATICIDGTPLPEGQVTGYTVQHSITDALPMLVLHTRQTDGVEWEGLARVAIGVPQDPADGIVAFLSSIDPDALARAALDRDLEPSKHSITRATLAQLIDWAQGRT
ncbi:hypothetical protein [Streptomyces sp. 8L]|uniref:hypothetical protein n=1 Tax=Streptomyces sp. 8L TaxID=2877242 RepID=UPI001CD46AAA|nr:hypothetical protein [Streptomyces sp. 8L]MCA1220254.1 hypothetical protein [Streptomyces sp. 8L]